MRYLTFLVFLFFLTACTSDASASDPTASGSATETSAPAPGVQPRATVEAKGDIAATPFTTFPDGIDSCVCTLRLDPQTEGKEDLFFVFNWKGGPGVIGVNGEEVTVARSTVITPKSKLRDSYLHENDRYSVYTTISDEGPAGEEGGMYSGTIKVIDKQTGAVMLARVSGTCSC